MHYFCLILFTISLTNEPYSVIAATQPPLPLRLHRHHFLWLEGTLLEQIVQMFLPVVHDKVRRRQTFEDRAHARLEIVEKQRLIAARKVLRYAVDDGSGGEIGTVHVRTVDDDRKRLADRLLCHQIAHVINGRED
uniref:Putative secreted peptide n=1 Tax=Anopheles braziliensis TaxID=58242 RepID=A0A2M3ZMG2_9DIPT